MYAALRLELPAVPGPDQRDRNDLLIVLDMFQVLERRVELGHIEVGDIADVAKPVVPVLPRLADEVVYIALAEQTVGVLMLLRSIYDALDLNSHFKLFQLVSRRGFGLHRRLGLVAFDIERHAAFLGNPLAAHPSQGEFFRVVTSERVCAVRGNVAANIRVRSNGDLAGIAVGRVAFYLADREGVILKIIGFLRVIGRFCAALDRNQTGFLEVAFTGLVRHGRGVLLPDRVDGLGRIVLGQRNLVAAMVLHNRSIRIVCPAKERVAVTGRLAFVDVDLVAFRRCGCLNIPARTTNVVKLVNQMVGVHGSVAVNRKG